MNTKKIDKILQNIDCKHGTSLDPRLQEYLKKKAYYKDYNITPVISPDIEFNITDHDIMIIRRFIDGDKKINDSKNHILNSKTFKTVKSKFPKAQKKPVYEMPKNMGMFVPDGLHGSFYDVRYNTNKSNIDIRDNIGIATRSGQKNNYDSKTEHNYSYIGEYAISKDLLPFAQTTH